MSEQIAVRIPNDMAASLEDLVGRGVYETKADAIRSALERLLDAERRRRVGELIADGYRAVPQDDGDVQAATRAAIRSINEEPW
jgi:Arc/MetJ-type ribon-helix-helix transcriptional regulator